MTPPAPPAARSLLALFASALALLALGVRVTPVHAADEFAKDRAEITAIHAGFDGAYKLGCWTQLRVELTAGDEPLTGRLQVTAQDPDGVAVNFYTPSDERIELATGEKTTAKLFVRFGQQRAPATVKLVDANNRELAARTYLPGTAVTSDDDQNVLRSGLPATGRLLVTFGSQRGLADIARDEQSAGPSDTIRIVKLAMPDDLPTRWYGYEGVETVVLGGSQLKLYDGLAADDPRLVALSQWLELGGELVIFCGAAAPELLGDDGPLAALVPARFTGEFAPLPDFTPLEVFSGADVAITRTGKKLNIPVLTEVTGEVVVQGGGQGGADLPIVIRQRRGFGEVTFVALDPDAEPLSDWSGRSSLLRQALGWPSAADESGPQSRDLGARGSSDLVTQLTRALDAQLAGVSVAPFALVTALVLSYVILIGPVDYFLLRRLNRPQLTWITFPLTIVATSAAAWWFAHRLKGDELRVNQVEIVDVDLATGNARGTAWTYLFSPDVARYHLSFAPHFGAKPLDPRTSNLDSPLPAWLGAATARTQRGLASLFEQGYGIVVGPTHTAIAGVPVEQWSTKGLTARWRATLPNSLEAQLEARPDGQLDGKIINRTGVRLEDCVLMRGGWAYVLEPLADGATVKVDASRKPRSLRSALTSVAAGDDPNTPAADEGSVIFDPTSIDVARIAKAMMFYDAIGGAAYHRTSHRYQSFIDMSRLLHGDQAILLARAPSSAASPWLSLDLKHPLTNVKTFPKPLASQHDQHWTYYRFVIPLKNNTPKQSRPIIGPTATP